MMQLFAWLALALSAVAILLLVGTALQHLFLRTPFVRTSHALAQGMVQIAGLKAGERVIDLGAGDGTILLEAVGACPAIVALGVEIVPLVWLLGWIRTRRKGIQFLLRDARSIDLHHVQVVFLYMTPYLLKELLPALSKLPLGARVISRTFSLPGKAAAEERMIGKEKIFVYRF